MVVIRVRMRVFSACAEVVPVATAAMVAHGSILRVRGGSSMDLFRTRVQH